MAKPEDLEERIADLEIRLAYHDRTVATWDEVMRELSRRIDQVEQQVARLGRDKLATP